MRCADFYSSAFGGTVADTPRFLNIAKRKEADMIDYRQMNIVMEAFCVVLCSLLLFYLYLDRHEKDKTNKWFFGMVLSNICMLLGDMTDWTLSNTPGTAAHLTLWIGLILYFSSSGMLMLTYTGYVISHIEGKSIRVPKIVLRLAMLLAGITALTALTTPFTKGLFYIARPDNSYNRGSFYIVSQISTYSIYIIAIYLLIRYRKNLRRKELLFFWSYIVLPILAQIVQMATYEIAALNVAVTFVLMLIFIFIQSEIKLEMERKEHALKKIEMDHMEILQEHQERLLDQIITALSNTVEAKDIYTGGHSARVAAYVREIMCRMGASEQEQIDAYYIGLLHDVGKIRVSDSIINKNGRLTDEEYEQMKLHTVAGYHILKEVTMIPDLVMGARWHHERYDGKGYPNGLSGENIPLIARIISVADSYDAMTSNRSYRETMPQQKVRQEIEKGMGTQFDPEIAQIMLDMIDEDNDYEMKQVISSYGKNILLIDDDEMVYQFVQLALKDDHYILTYAGNAEEGIRLMQEEKFDLVLLDVEMKGKNGFDVLKWIRDNEIRIKVIILTGDKEMRVIKQGEELGASDYVTKPILLPVLKESIANVLRH